MTRLEVAAYPLRLLRYVALATAGVVLVCEAVWWLEFGRWCFVTLLDGKPDTAWKGWNDLAWILGSVPIWLYCLVAASALNWLSQRIKLRSYENRRLRESTRQAGDDP